MKKILIFMFALFTIVSCSVDDFGPERSNERVLNPVLDASADFLKLTDDSTNVAGEIEINANTSEVDLKWNVPPGCNLDTTTTRLSLINGKCKMTVRWDKRINGTYGPAEQAYKAGVLITSKDFQKYIPLVWADAVDSLKIIQNTKVTSRSAAFVMPRAEGVTITPQMIMMDKFTGGSASISFPEGTVFVDYYNLQTELTNEVTHLDEAIMNQIGFIDTSPYIATYTWDLQGAPESSFIGHVAYSLNGIIKYLYLNYEAKPNPEWEYKSCTPDSLSILPAMGATVIVEALSKYCQWSIESADAITTPVDNGDGNSEGTQLLAIKIADNPGITTRDITVTVKANTQVPQTKILRFKQAGIDGGFKIDSIIPNTDVPLNSGEQIIKAYVQSSRIWWMSYEGKQINFLPSDKMGSVTIPEYKGSIDRIISITVGYDDKIVGTYNYIQKPGEELRFKTSTLPERGNIPVDGGSFIFTFEGTYTGELQILAELQDGTQIIGQPATNKSPIVTVPNNYTNLNSRTVKFKYRKGTGEWVDLNLQRTQDEATINVKVLLPGVIPREGGDYTAVFSGTYRGPVKVKATSGTLVISRDGNSPGEVDIEIPELTAMEDREFTFEYSLDGGISWKEIAKKTQSAGTLRWGSITPAGVIPASGGKYSCAFEGSYPGIIYFRAISGATVLDSKESKIPSTFTLTIPENKDSAQRQVFFQYSKDNVNWIEMEKRFQSKNIKVDGSDADSNGFGNEDKTDIDVEL